MALSEMVVFNDYIMPLTIERLGQMVEAFNEASNGTIQMSAQAFTGDYFQQSFFSSLSAAQRRVDRYAAQGAVAATDLSQVKHSTVKVAGGFGPIRYEPSQMTWMRNPDAAALEAASSAFAELLMQDQLNTAILALRAAISNQAAATNDVSGSAGVSHTALNDGDAKFGDRSGSLAARICTGAAYHKLIGLNLTNANNLFRADGVAIVDVLGKVFVVTDAPALYVAGTPNKSYVLTLTEGAAVVMNGSQPVTNIETSNGQTRIETTMQVDYDFGLGLKGYTWDETNGGKSPDNTDLGTGSNWDLVVSDIKMSAGTAVVGDADA
jgi:hypothetical protein